MNVHSPGPNQIIKRALFPVLLLAGAVLSGCTSTVYFAGKKSELRRFDGGMEPVYVTNPEMTPEYRILKSSGIYRLSNDSDGARRLTLQRMGRLPVCGNPLIGTIFTLGTIPVVLPDPSFFEYELETNGSGEKVRHLLSLRERFSVWEWALRWNQKKAYAQALAFSA